jgi:hypothetical protein
MANLIPEQLALLDHAAELRAGGSPWAAVATELKVAPDELRSLRATHARFYDRLARHADREFERETVRATLARLRELMRSSDESVAMLAAGTVIRYELARMRQELQKERGRVSREARRELLPWRNETPPAPSRPVSTARPQENAKCDRGCDSVASRPQAPMNPGVASSAGTQKPARCDTAPSASAAPVTAPKPAPAVPASNSVPPSPAKRNTTIMDAIRRKKWLPDGL